jgi:hypothetical protein
MLRVYAGEYDSVNVGRRRGRRAGSRDRRECALLGLKVFSRAHRWTDYREKKMERRWRWWWWWLLGLLFDRTQKAVRAVEGSLRANAAQDT